MKVFVTGGAGYVGSHCCKLLRESGHELKVYDNLSTGHAVATPKDELVVGDLADRELLEKTLTDFAPDAVMHFAASAYVGESVQQPLKYYRNNVVNTVGLLEIMEKLDIRKLVFSSSCSIYGVPPSTPITEDMPANPLSPYARSKRMMEQVFADCTVAWDLGYAALRYFNAAGASFDGSIGEDHDPEAHLIPIVLQVALGQRDKVQIFGTDYPTPDGTCVRDYIHVEDLADAHLKALTELKPGRELIANLGTGNGNSVREVIETARKVTGCDIETVEGPRRPGDSPALFANAALAATLLNWQAKVTELQDVIATAWEWHRHHPNGFEG